MGLGTEMRSGKALFSSLDKPKFIKALILKSYVNLQEIDALSDSLFLLVVFFFMFCIKEKIKVFCKKKNKIMDTFAND